MSRESIFNLVTHILRLQTLVESVLYKDSLVCDKDKWET